MISQPAPVRTLTASVGTRRTLWPVELMQDWIAACLCPTMDTQPRSPAPPVTAPPVATPAPPVIVSPPLQAFPGGIPDLTFVPQTPPRVITQPDPRIRPGEAVRELAPLALAPDPRTGPSTPVELAPDAVVGLRDRLGGSVTGVGGVGEARAKALSGIGVTTEGEFLTAPQARLASTLNLPEAKVVEMKQGLNEKHNLGLAFR